MSAPEIRPATAADLPSITEIYDHAVRHGTATFELIPPDLPEMTRRFAALADGGFPYLVASTMLQFLVSVVGVLVFAGLTAWDTQRLKNDYIYGYASQGGDVAERAAISGALSLYLNFINLFTLLLQLLGQRD